MENMDFEIDLFEEDVESVSARKFKLPKHTKKIGRLGKNDACIYIKAEVHEALEAYAATDTTKELGSFLLGDYWEDKKGIYHIVISDYVEAKHTDASKITLTYTHETWNDFFETKEKIYPEKKLVGWQHTHPNYGIFLSSYDLFIQEHTFCFPFQVAYVIDPVRKRRGFFAWKDGKIDQLNPLKGYYIYKE